MEGCSLIVYGNNSFPDQYRALLETISLFETTNLAAQNFNESLCALKRIVTPNLNDTVSIAISSHTSKMHITVQQLLVLDKFYC